MDVDIDVGIMGWSESEEPGAAESFPREHEVLYREASLDIDVLEQAFLPELGALFMGVMTNRRILMDTFDIVLVQSCSQSTL